MNFQFVISLGRDRSERMRFAARRRREFNSFQMDFTATVPHNEDIVYVT